MPAPKHSTASALLIDFRPVALTSIMAKCLERRGSITSEILFAYCTPTGQQRTSSPWHSARPRPTWTVPALLLNQNAVQWLQLQHSTLWSPPSWSPSISSSLRNWTGTFWPTDPNLLKLDNLSSSTLTLSYMHDSRLCANSVHISDDLTWALNSSILLKKARQCTCTSPWSSTVSKDTGRLLPLYLPRVYSPTESQWGTTIAWHQTVKHSCGWWKLPNGITGTQLPTIENI